MEMTWGMDFIYRTLCDFLLDPKALEKVAHWSAILTSVIAVFGYGKYRVDLCSKRRRLENHLRKEKEKGRDKGQRTILHLIAEIGLTETEILQASFRSKCVKRRKSVDDKDNRTNAILLEYQKPRGWFSKKPSAP